MFHYIRLPFGFIMKTLFSWTHNYLIAVILFAVVLKVVLFPLGIKQQKNSQKQAKLRPKENVIRKKYAGRNDRATQLKMNTEIQELYQKEKFSPLAGCLPLIVQLLILLAVYGVVQSPLTYMANIPADTVGDVKTTVSEMVYADEETRESISLYLNKADSEENFKKALENESFSAYAEINVIDYIQNHEDEFVAVYDAKYPDAEMSGKEVAETIPDIDIGKGFNLGTRPQDVFSKFFTSEAKLGERLILLVPILNLVTAYVGQALTRKFTYQPEQTPEMQSQTRMMNITMPLFSLFVAFTLPVAVGIYWMIQNLLSPVQQFALSKLFPIPVITPEEMREAEKQYGSKQKHKKVKTDSTAKKKSLVYDDDDEYESISTTKEVKVLKEKKETEANSVVEKAPLKEEDK